jgi:O-antigen ligase
LIIAALAVFAVIGIIALIILEERGRPEVILLVVLGFILVDALLFPDGGNEPPGIFRLTILGHDYRTADLLIVLGLVARLASRGLPRRVTGTGLLWGTFFAVFVLAAPLGLANGHSSTLVIFQTKFVLETGGMAVLVAGVALSKLTSPSFIGKTAWFVGMLSIVPIIFGSLGKAEYLPLPHGAGFANQGLGADTATVLLSFGFLLMMVEVCSRHPRVGVIMWCGLLIICPIFTGQRAALIGMVVTLSCVAVVMLGRRWRQRSPARLTQLLPVIACVVIPLGTIALLNARTSPASSSIPVVSSLGGRFGGTGKTQSANVRLTVWTLGRHLAEERPVFGWGLGQDFNVFQSNGSEDPFTGGDFHDIAIDLAVTTGVTGLALFGFALTASLWSAFVTWRIGRNGAISAMALAAGILILQLIAKGLFESVFQKYRLALIFGLFIGIIAAAARTQDRDAVESGVESDVREPAWT